MTPTDMRVERLAKRFGGLRVLEDVSFHMPPGSVLGVVGPNGAGKTTLINLITGRLAPSAGRVTIGDRDVTGAPAHAMSRLGIVRSFQQTNVFRSATVHENIDRAIRFSGGGSSAWRRTEGLLAEFGLDSKRDDRSDSLPYGLQKMLGLLAAYATGARLLLLDEPAAGLEHSERPRIDRLVQQAQADGVSVLVIEHDMELVRRLCPRILMLDGGRILAEGPPAEVFARPDVIAAYVGEADADTDEGAA